MTYDKQSNGHLAKPFTPTLSAAFSRANTKSPLTPKLANPSTVRAPKRLAPPDHPATTPARQNPEPSYLNANITPRSGSRNSRRDGPILSAGNTPLHSPQSFVQASPANGPTPRAYRTERSPARIGGKLELPRTVRAKTLTADLSTASRPHSTEFSAASPMFFHASDARSVSSSSDADTRSRVSAKSSSPATFIYANGQEENQHLAEETSRRRSSGLSRPAVVSRPTASPRIKSPQLNASSPRISDSISSVGGPHLDDSPEIRSPVHSPPLSTVRPVPVISHTKSSSLDTARGTPIKETYGEVLRPSSVTVSTLDSQVEENNASDALPALRPRIFSHGSTNSVDSHNDGLQSPVKSEHGGSSGPVLSARVERKILDLEISNSSLLAINRTLEREMKKQNAELRRFRRLSRSGRLSVAPSRSVSGTLSIPSEIDESGSEVSSNHSQEEPSEFSDEESMLDESSLGPDSIAEEDAKHGNKDEKRFLIDLAKHQELLSDSQKMNQSLKRCLGWTEELIKEAQKALAYNVHVNDIQLGGRVLSPDEYGDGESGRGLLAAVSPEAEFPPMDPPGEDSPSI
ncbi:uncharacterized protein DSM5745_03756 [Aspergillus mulundensis]|uniref:Uncharacterized protein n=1 Tax=Aspergillus mulundensis TaxID=1810919 RepID=A0A3D8SLP1_9EURO|nr:Uncharacterized protein DSM5745_03756 [Aspergillus mulundensis]RDW87114.1 Uncharacterized protein DSM5745_03756 [Aspergillus mulundensis]